MSLMNTSDPIDGEANPLLESDDAMEVKQELDASIEFDQTKSPSCYALVSEASEASPPSYTDVPGSYPLIISEFFKNVKIYADGDKFKVRANCKVCNKDRPIVGEWAPRRVTSNFVTHLKVCSGAYFQMYHDMKKDTQGKRYVNRFISSMLHNSPPLYLGYNTKLDNNSTLTSSVHLTKETNGTINERNRSPVRPILKPEAHCVNSISTITTTSNQQNMFYSSNSLSSIENCNSHSRFDLVRPLNIESSQITAFNKWDVKLSPNAFFSACHDVSSTAQSQALNCVIKNSDNSDFCLVSKSAAHELIKHKTVAGENIGLHEQSINTKQKQIEIAMSVFLACEGYDLSLTTSLSFVNLLRVCNPDVEIPSRQVLEQQIVSLSHQIQTTIKRIISIESYFSLSVGQLPADESSFPLGIMLVLGYMHKGKLYHGIMDIVDTSKEELICNIINTILHDFGAQGKIVSIITPNIDLQLDVCNGNLPTIKLPFFGDMLDSIVVTSIQCSSMEIQTIWNRIFNLFPNRLVSATGHVDALSKILADNSGDLQSFKSTNMIKEMLHLLSNFTNALTMFKSSASHVSSSKVLPLIKGVEKRLSNASLSCVDCDRFRHVLIRKMADCFEAFLSGENHFYIAASFTDPNYKFFWVEDSYVETKYRQIIQKLMLDSRPCGEDMYNPLRSTSSHNFPSEEDNLLNFVAKRRSLAMQQNFSSHSRCLPSHGDNNCTTTCDSLIPKQPDVTEELHNYLNDSDILEPLEFWRHGGLDKQEKFPRIYKLHLQYHVAEPLPTVLKHRTSMPNLNDYHASVIKSLLIIRNSEMMLPLCDT